VPKADILRRSKMRLFDYLVSDAQQSRVPPSAEIVTYKKASVADLKPGQKIFVFAAKKLPDDMLEAPNISFGDYGVWR
jgi:hypothetical protein